ncbi:penicillin-binding protein 1C [Acidovorax carolinensis]|uniref:peptidoglycan glycosyltransferase n=1 Tax=Acidovorax carolinensis TaxID=553814 RepID=A0A240UEE7_9BURK|nr:penicillin-binding protein 1C [Acidovorax carolinensis]ART59874.1 penicillin-binding protein 1C [Acidovorax carolinensis]
MTERWWTVRPWCAGGALWVVCASAAWAIPPFGEVRADFQPSDTLILSREGEVLQRLRVDATVRRGQWVPLAEVSPALRQALVLSEDKRFFEHSGVDWRAASAAAWGNLWNQRTRGASTITMQLAGLLDGDWRQGPGGRSVAQKLGQTVAAQVLDRRWRKDQILEAYLNLVPFRSELVGIDALSRTLFGKAAHGLDDREAAVAAALVRAPNARPALVAQRACGVLRDMQQRPGNGAARVDCDALDLFTTAALQRRAFDASDGVAPHFARYLLRQRFKDGAVPERVPSTLRAPLQRFAVQSLQQQLRELRGRHVEDGAVLVLDNATGAVLAWVGSSGALSQAGEVDGVLALRQPGSTLKPFLYAQAIAEQRLTAASLVQDSPAQITTASGLYIPQNYDRQFKGWVSVRTALAASLNVPAVRALVMVTPDAFHRQLAAVGLPLRESGDYFGYSLALGSPEVPLLHLTNAFRTLANGGRASAVALADAKAHFTPAIDAHAAYIVGDILSDGNARARTFGADSVLATRFWSAVKTGTSKDMRDNWAVGWSERYTVGVWVGNASGAAMHDVSGTSGAAPVWAAVMGFLHAREPSRPPGAPAGLVRAAVRFGPAQPPPAGNAQPLEAAREEWFVPGTQQALFAMDSVAVDADESSARGQKSSKTAARGAPAPATTGAAARITAPPPGTIVALDPDIPPARQRLHLRASGQGLHWRLDGKPLGRGPQVGWLPWPGRHVIQLTDAAGTVLDEVRIEVRGAGVRASAAPGR